MEYYKSKMYRNVKYIEKNAVETFIFYFDPGILKSKYQ